MIISKGKFMMRIRWRNLELPIRVVSNPDVPSLNDDSYDKYGEFIAEPFERGFGRTIGNALRRILLSSIEGCAVTSVQIEGAKHEFTSLPGVMEDVIDIIINIKKLRIQMDIEEKSPIKLKINVQKKGVVTAADIVVEGKASIVNQNLVIATLTEEREFKVEMQARRDRGYVTAEENQNHLDPQVIGVLPIASIFSPVRHVQYWIENTRVGKITNYDRLIMGIRTDGTITPEMALVEAAKILRKHLNPFVQYFDMGEEIAHEDVEIIEEGEEEDQNRQKLFEKLDLPVEKLELSVRASNCLSSAGIHTVKDLVQCLETDLLKIRNFGKTSLVDIKEKLKAMNLSLGMTVDTGILNK